MRLKWPVQPVWHLLSSTRERPARGIHIFERDPLGNYTITVTGLTSKRTASAGLQVVQPGS
jgi:hypothetical protein